MAAILQWELAILLGRAYALVTNFRTKEDRFKSIKRVHKFEVYLIWRIGISTCAQQVVTAFSGSYNCNYSMSIRKVIIDISTMLH